MESSETECPIEETSVTLRIFEPGLLPEDVTQNLGITPDRTHRQGDFPKGNPKYSAYKHGMWSLKSRIPADKSLEDHLDSIITLLEPKQSYIQSLATHASVDFYWLPYGQSGFQLSPRILKRIAELGATFGVVLYS
ncbi:MAG TPA: DUF4279 domain-containing protein [Anaerolineales bacterium]|nr:DUF4279 domain-containing protein [Anaerolineales bacterium]